MAEQNGSEQDYLRIEHVHKRFGGVQALSDAGLCCRKGETHVLIGENGAGKSTIVKILCGVVERDSGDIFISGEQVRIDNAADAESHGIAAVFQELSLIQDLSAAENIFLGREPTNKLGRIDFKGIYRQAGDFLAKLGIALNPRKLVRDLSLCDQQMVEIAKALFKSPEILILDEATSALGEREVHWLFDKVKQLTEVENKTVIFISHRMDELRQIADRATIFRDARYILTFNWGELSDDEIVTYISGKAADEVELERNLPKSGDITLEVRGGFREEKLHDINFCLRRGEILGIAGLSGHGQVALLHALFGDGVFDEGAILRDGKTVKIRNERDAMRHGIVLVPEDRKHEGLVLERPIGENITIMALKKLQHFGVINGRREQESIRRSVDELSIKANDVGLNANSLSGGNQQKVVIAKALLTQPQVLLLSDPTRGIDIGTKVEIYKLMHRLAQTGMSILFLSTELSELTRLCSRVLVFYEGGIAAELTGSDITEENIIAYAIGVESEGAAQ